MIPAIIIISLALYWLGHETQWLTIRLLAGCHWPDIDLDVNFDGGDCDFLDDYEIQSTEAIEMDWLSKYNEWIHNQPNPAWVMSCSKRGNDRYQRELDYEEQQKRYNGTGIYARSFAMQSLIERS